MGRHLCSSRTLKILITLIILTVPVLGQGRSGFRTLTGAAARGFEVPADSRQSSSMNLGRYGLHSVRYQQYLGEAAFRGSGL